MSERVAWVRVNEQTPPDMFIRVANDQLARMAAGVARLQETRVLPVSSDTPLTAGEDIVLANTNGGNITCTLPDARQHSGHVYQVKKTDAANTLTVAASGSDTVDGGASSAWTTANESRTFVACVVTTPATWGWVII